MNEQSSNTLTSNQPAGSEGLIRQIYAITNAHEQGLDYQMQELLRIGLERFKLHIGILSRISGNVYTVEHCVAPEELGIAAGDTFEFNKTYCHITCSKGEALALEQVGGHDEYASHPAYAALGLESYIGIPISCQGSLYGTLNFSSAEAYQRSFDAQDLDAMLLLASWIESELVRRDQEQKLRELNDKLENEALLDSLTQIPNRRGLQAHLRREINRLVRSGGRATLALIDLDHFKALNDTHGHQAGDQALVSSAKTIAGSIRGYDYLARFGGEEFLLLLPDTSLKLSTVVCQRILDNIAKQSFPFGSITASAGSCQIECSEVDPDQIDAAIEQAIAEADKALYAAKENGRNQHVIFGQHRPAA